MLEWVDWQIALAGHSKNWERTHTFDIYDGVSEAEITNKYTTKQHNFFKRLHRTFRSLLSNSAIPLCPCLRAVISALIPSPFLISVLHPARHRHLWDMNKEISVIKAIYRRLFHQQNTYITKIKYLITSMWPCRAAKWRGVRPCLLATSTLHPKAHRVWIAARRPWWAAKWIGASPS